MLLFWINTDLLTQSHADLVDPIFRSGYGSMSSQFVGQFYDSTSLQQPLKRQKLLSQEKKQTKTAANETSSIFFLGGLLV